MTDYLSAHIHLATLGADLVLLDERTNAYFCLPGAGEALTAQGRLVAFSDPGLREAFAAEAFIGGPMCESKAHGAPPARRDLKLSVATRVKIADALLIVAAWLSMFVSYHGRSFAHLLRVARLQQRDGVVAGLSDETVRLTAAFERVLPWLPFQGVCLYRAFLLRRILHWRGQSTHWVFGVQTWPFYAHCWLQIGDVALDDTADRLAAYEPILVV